MSTVGAPAHPVTSGQWYYEVECHTVGGGAQDVQVRGLHAPSPIPRPLSHTGRLIYPLI